MFKRLIAVALVAATVSLFARPAPAVAGDVYSRAVITNGTATGTCTWTNTMRYVAIDLKRIWVSKSLTASDTVTIQRVTADNVFTQAVGSVTVSTSAGNTASFTAEYLAYGDKLVPSSSATTGSVIMIEYVVQNP